MYLERLELTDFRSYASASLELEPGVAVVIGDNGQGKTNLLEAAHYLAIGASHRVSADAPLVRAEAAAAIIRAASRVDTGRFSAAPDRSDAAAATQASRRLTVEFEIRPSGRNRAKVNGQAQPRSRDALGLVRSVLFAPEDLGLVRGDPGERRRFLDHLLTQRRPAYLAARQEYDRVLRQRNALLRDARAGASLQPGPLLETWTDALAAAGATVLAARIAVVHALAGPVDEAYRQLAGDAKAPGLGYVLSTGRTVEAQPSAGMPSPGALAEELRDGLQRAGAAELQRGITLAGPHRDELAVSLGGMAAKGYASHGETWSLALALRLASREVLLDVGEEPIVLLDDVFAELDADRRERLAARCADFEQVLVTAAVDEDVPLSGPRHVVRAGTVAPAGLAHAPGEEPDGDAA